MMKGGREGGSEGKKNISPRSVPLRMSASSPSPPPRPPALSSSLFFFSPLLSPCCLPSSHFLISHIMRSFPRRGMYHSYNATGTATRQYEHANCGYGKYFLLDIYTLDLLTGHISTSISRDYIFNFVEFSDREPHANNIDRRVSES